MGVVDVGGELEGEGLGVTKNRRWDGKRQECGL